MFTVSCQQKCMSYTNSTARQNAQIFTPLFSNSNSLHMSKSQQCLDFNIMHARKSTDTCTSSTHAQGSRDSAAVLITPNGSIRLTVMINPVESLPLHSATCRAAAPPHPAFPALIDRWRTWWSACMH